MKHTIPLDATRSVQLEDVGTECHIRLLTFGVTAMKQTVPPELLLALASSAQAVANAAMGHEGGVRCRDPAACKAGQVPCPTRKACGLEG